MPRCGYERKDPVVYAAQRRELALRVRDGMAVRAAARVLNIPYSTAWLWVAQDGLRKCDRAADEAGEPRPAVGNWAKPGRGRPAVEADGLPPADYPELKGLSPRRRLTKLGEMAGHLEMRAVAAIEEGAVGYALSTLREAERLRRVWRVLRDWLEQYPEPEAGEADVYFDEVIEEIEAAQEGRAPVYREAPPPTPEQLTEKAIDEEIWAAILDVEAAHLAALGKTREDFPEEEVIARELQMAEEFWRLREARERWMSLPGRTPPPIVVNLPQRRGG